MGFVTASAACAGCGQLFTFNPVRVPSIRIGGERQPICRDCIERVNPIRMRNGLDPIVPEPDAYTGCDEAELP